MRGRDVTANRLLILKKRVGGLIFCKGQDSSMLQTYTKQDDIPEGLREHYKLIEGKWVAEVGDDHPLKVNNTKLLTEKSEAEAKLVNTQTELTAAKADAEAAKNSGLPRGHVAVPKTDADLIGVVKAAGITKPEEFTAIKDEHATFKTKVAAQERREHLDAVRKAEGWGDSAVDVLSLIQDLPDVELRDTEEKDDNGVPKKKAIAKVKGADNVVTEKPFGEYFAAKHAALLPSLQAVKQADGTPLPSHGAGGGGSKTNPADSYLASVDSAPKSRQAAAA